MSSYTPPYTISEKILEQVSSISEKNLTVEESGIFRKGDEGVFSGD